METLKEAIISDGKPMTINSDQVSQFTSSMWTHYLESESILISMDGKGKATDNSWIERFSKTLQYDCIYLNPFDIGFELYEGVQNPFTYFQQKVHIITKQSPNCSYQELIKNHAGKMIYISFARYILFATNMEYYGQRVKKKGICWDNSLQYNSEING